MGMYWTSLLPESAHKMSTARNTWKQRERDAADEFGTKRQPSSGSMGRSDQTRSDSVHPAVFIECKLRPSHAPVTVWRDAAEKAKKEGKTPVVCLMEKFHKGRWWLLHSSHLRTLTIEWLASKSDVFFDQLIIDVATVKRERQAK